jgi:hypothetical protein
MRDITISLAVAIAITSLFAFVLSAHGGSVATGAAREQVETAYIVTANPYLSIQTVEPAY